jgi:putative ABC transport system substrate-binding protein
MKSRRRLLAQFIAAMAAMPLTALGQGSAKPWRVAYFSGGMRPADGAVPAPLRQGLTELGYVEGRNVQYDGRWTQGDASRLPAVAAELAAARPDVVVVRLSGDVGDPTRDKHHSDRHGSAR